MQLDHVKTFGLQDNFASIREINCPVEELADQEKVILLTFEECCKAIEEDGSQSFILGCTGFVGIAESVSKMLSEKYGGYIPVCDPNLTAFSYLVSLVRTNMCQSRITYNKANLT